MKKLLFAVGYISLFLICASSFAQPKAKILFHAEDKIPTWLTENKVPAAGVGIIENGKIKFVKVYGYSRKNVRATPNTIFNIASMTKPVVAMLTLKLVQAGKWNLDEPLSNYWIDPDIANDPWLKKLTTYHVLTHQTGFPNWRRDSKLAFNFEPGTKFQYSGEGLEYLKTALEKKFKRSLEKLLDSILFKPLGMKNTSYWGNNIEMSRFAYWHDAQGNEYNTSYKTAVSAADDLLTTVEDYCKFIIYVMNGAGLSKALYNEMIKPQVAVKEHSARGLGWEVIKDLPGSEYALLHGGGDIGVKTIGIILPESKRGIVVFTNGDNGTVVSDNIIRESIDIGQTILDYSNGAHNATTVKLADNILDRYVGKYLRSDANAAIIITREGSELKLTGDGLPMLILLPESENRFFVKGLGYQYEFVKDISNNTMKLRILESGKLLLDATKTN